MNIRPISYATIDKQKSLIFFLLLSKAFHFHWFKKKNEKTSRFFVFESANFLPNSSSKFCPRRRFFDLVRPGWINLVLDVDFRIVLDLQTGDIRKSLCCVQVSRNHPIFNTICYFHPLLVSVIALRISYNQRFRWLLGKNLYE